MDHAWCRELMLSDEQVDRKMEDVLELIEFMDTVVELS